MRPFVLMALIGLATGCTAADDAAPRFKEVDAGEPTEQGEPESRKKGARERRDKDDAAPDQEGELQLDGEYVVKGSLLLTSDELGTKPEEECTPVVRADRAIVATLDSTHTIAMRDVEGQTCTPQEPLQFMVMAKCKGGQQALVQAMDVGTRLSCTNAADEERTLTDGFVPYEALAQTTRDEVAELETEETEIDVYYDFDSQAYAETGEGELVGTVEKTGCSDLRQMLLERDPNAPDSDLRPSYTAWARNAKVDPTSGCMTGSAEEMKKRYSDLIANKARYVYDLANALYVQQVYLQQAQASGSGAVPLLQQHVATATANLAKAKAGLKQMQQRKRDAVASGATCVVPGPHIRRAGEKVKKAGEAEKDYALEFIAGSGAGRTPIDTVKIAAQFRSAILDKKIIKTCPRFPEDKIEAILAAKDLLSDDKKTLRVLFSDFLRCNPYIHAVVTLDLTVHDASGAQIGEACKHSFIEASPLVLDLSGAAMLATTSPAESRAQFDLLATGQRRATGWIAQGTGFLALDLNDNGAIDDGRELFGEATVLRAGGIARNGFLALAQYDEAGKGYVDGKDAVFARLRVWLDDGDGVSTAQELKTLAELGITRLDTRYGDVPAELRRQGGPLGNDVRYQARFHGPKACGQDGCGLYDVYFGSKN